MRRPIDRTPETSRKHAREDPNDYPLFASAHSWRWTGRYILRLVWSKKDASSQLALSSAPRFYSSVAPRRGIALGENPLEGARPPPDAVEMRRFRGDFGSLGGSDGYLRCLPEAMNTFINSLSVPYRDT